MSKLYDPDRVSRLAQISTRFHAHARVGDEVQLGIDGDDQMPAKYRGAGNRPVGTIVGIKNEGTEDSTLRVQLTSGRNVTLLPHQLSGERVWEFTDRSWPNVLSRSQAGAQGDTAYRGAASKADDLSKLRQEMADMSQRFERELAEAKGFRGAIVESIASMTNEISQTNPDARFSRTFQEEYRGVHKSNPSPFDSDYDSDA